MRHVEREREEEAEDCAIQRLALAKTRSVGRDCCCHPLETTRMIMSPLNEKPSTVNRQVNVYLAYDLSFSFDDA